MKNGLLWYDADSLTSLPDKVARAAQRYRQKLGRCPTLCYVHPAALGDGELELACRLDGGMTIRVRLVSAAQVLRHHFWLGEEEVPVPGKQEQAVKQPEVSPAHPGDPLLPAQEHLLRKAARRRREEGRLLEEAMAVRSGEQRQQAAKKARR